MKKTLFLSLLVGVSFGLAGITNTVNADAERPTTVKVNNAADGALKFVSITPEKIVFKKITLDKQHETTTSYQDPTKLANDVGVNVSILDSRGTAKGWTLQAKLVGDTPTAPWDAWNHKLKGAEMKFDFTDGTTISHDGSTAPSDITDAPKLVDQVTLSIDYQNIMIADANKGMGEWSFHVATPGADGIGPVSVTVPSSITLASNYTSSVRWQLLDAPEA